MEPNGTDSKETRPYREERRQRSSSTRLLLFLVVLFTLTTVALAVVLAVTVLKVKDIDKDNDKTVAVQVSGEHGDVPSSVATTRAQPSTHALSSTHASPKDAQTTPSPPREQHDDVCLTEGCVLAAARVQSAIDSSVQPCDNFYNFACGSWIRQHIIPEDKGSFGTFTKLRDDVDVTLKYIFEAEPDPNESEIVMKALNYFKACVNVSRIEELGLTKIHQFMTDLGGWPTMGNKDGGRWSEQNYKLEDLLALARKGITYLPILDIYVSQDDKHPSKHILATDQPGLGMPSRDYYLKGRDDKTLMAYQTMIKDLSIAFGADATTAANDAKDIVDFEIEIANITVLKEERRDADKLYNLMKIGDLSKNFSGFEWTYFINKVFENIDMTLNESEPIVVVAPDYFREVFGMLKRFPPRTITNYIVLRRVMGKTSYLPEVFRDIMTKYSSVLSGTATRPPRWHSCASTVKDAMPEVVGRLFVKEAFHEDAKQDVLNLIDKLKLSFKGMLGQNNWMDEQTKDIAREKVDAVQPRIGYPDLVMNISRMTEEYENVTVVGDDPLQTLVNFGIDGARQNLMRLRKEYNRESWGMSAATVNAYYSPSTNQITFPAAILQPPFYTKSQPTYLNFGGIGYVIGHEITHGFDDQGRRYDKHGNLKEWWSPEVVEKFKKEAQCIVDQYSNFTVPGTGGMTLNGINTLGENIADNGGIKESFYAYRHWVEEQGKEEPKLPGLSYTPNQLYFLNAAQVWCENMRDKSKIQRIRTDPHSIDIFRVLGPMQNFEEFSTAFNCKKGTFMNKENRCNVW